MLNIDGVVFGNNRCSLAGVDLNRQWKVLVKESFYLHSILIFRNQIQNTIQPYLQSNHSFYQPKNQGMFGCILISIPTLESRIYFCMVVMIKRYQDHMLGISQDFYHPLPPPLLTSAMEIPLLLVFVIMFFYNFNREIEI